jgi:AcrR family transcriptional regulator
MSEKTEDRRLAKTRESLCRALHAMMGDTPWETITIKTICERANLARSSFYAHFDNKAELLEFLISQSVHSNFEKDSANPLGLLTWLVDHIAANRPLFARIVESPDAQQVMTKFKSALVVQLQDDLKRTGYQASAQVSIFILGGSIELIQQWAKTWQLNKLSKLRTDVLAMSHAVLGLATV